MLALAMLGGFAAQARASGVRRLVASVTSFSTDGTRFAAWQQTPLSAIVILDTATHARRQVPLPGCVLANQASGQGLPADVAGGAGFLVSCFKEPRDGCFVAFRLELRRCGEHFKAEEETDVEREAQAQSRQQVQHLLDPRSGTSLALPEGFGWNRVQAHSVEAVAEESSTRPCVASFNPATAAFTVSSSPALCTRLQHLGVTEPVCASLRRRLAQENRLEESGEGFTYEAGRLIHAARDLKHVVLESCHRRPVVLPGPVEPFRYVTLQGPEGAPSTRQVLSQGVPANFDLRDDLLTWNTGFSIYAYDETEDALAHGYLSAYRPASGWRRSWRLPSLPVYIAGERSVRGVFGYATHTAHTVFWIPTRGVSNEGREELCCTDAYGVYAAKF